MPSRSDLEIKSRLVLGLGLLSLVVVLLLKLLLPVLVIAGLGAGGYWLWRQWKQQQQQQQRRQARLDAKFYQLLRQQQGHISVLDFAMYAQIHGAAAQDYLNAQAQAFLAHFETTARGDIIYVFNLVAMQGNSGGHRAAQAEAAWAYAEQARSKRVQAEKAQAAWANAKQIRVLSQLSKQEIQEKEGHFPRENLGQRIDNLPQDLASQIAEPAHKTLASRKLPSHHLVRLPHEGPHERMPAPISAPLIKSAQGDDLSDDLTASPAAPAQNPEPIITIEVPAVRG